MHVLSKSNYRSYNKVFFSLTHIGGILHTIVNESVSSDQLCLIASVKAKNKTLSLRQNLGHVL